MKLGISREKALLIALLAVAGIIRLSLIDWDHGYHLHPDERMIIMVADRIHFFDNLNPNFFNYGSLPIYILKATADWHDALGLTPPLSNYDGMLGVGRVLATVYDLITIILIYKIGRVLWRKGSIALLAGATYAVAFFPIQNSHFYVVDGLLTTLSTFLIFLLIRYIKHPSVQKSAGIGVVLAAAVGTKFTAVLFGLPALAALILPYVWDYKKHRIRLKIKPVLSSLGNFSFSFLISFFLFMPYAVINMEDFVRDIMLQTRMSSDPFVFPYTLQYVQTTPYWYFLKNILIWGWGAPLSILTLVGCITLLYKVLKGRKRGKRAFIALIVGLYYIVFVAVIGRSAVKFMRYMLPVYPLFALLAGYGLYRISSYELRVLTPLPRIAGILLVSGVLVWTGMFLSIYQGKHTRVAASEWIYHNIPQGTTIATEHWDDRLPLRIRFAGDEQDFFAEMYPHEELALYEPDTSAKWHQINSQLSRADYIVIASNRLYTPLSRLTKCNNLPHGRCYYETARYYDELFNEEKDFVKVAEFTSFPRLEAGGWKLEVNDLSADESFTVYDHPKVMIFKRK